MTGVTTQRTEIKGYILADEMKGTVEGRSPTPFRYFTKDCKQDIKGEYRPWTYSFCTTYNLVRHSQIIHLPLKNFVYDFYFTSPKDKDDF